MIEILAALIAAGAAIIAAVITKRQDKRITETHKQVSENSHRNTTPTLLDMLTDVRDEQRRTNAVIIDHLEWHVGKTK